jgi:hypothetical protein
MDILIKEILSIEENTDEHGEVFILRNFIY